MRNNRFFTLLLAFVWLAPASCAQPSHDLSQEIGAILSQENLDAVSVDREGEALRVVDLPSAYQRSQDTETLIQLGWLKREPLYIGVPDMPVDDPDGMLAGALSNLHLASLPESFSFCAGDLICSDEVTGPQDSCKTWTCSETELVKNLGNALDKRTLSKSDDGSYYIVQSDTPLRLHEDGGQAVFTYRIGADGEHPLFIKVAAREESLPIIDKALLNSAIFASRNVIQRCPEGTAKVCVAFDENGKCLMYDCL